MLFKCGKDEETKKQFLTNWHTWYAIVPQVVSKSNGTYVYAWFQSIRRIGTYNRVFRSWSWKYKLIDESGD